MIWLERLAPLVTIAIAIFMLGYCVGTYHPGVR